MKDAAKVRFSHYPAYAELTAFLKACEKASDGWMRLESLAQTREGREVWLAVFGDPASGDPDAKPGYYVQANMHSHEMCGTLAAMHLVRTLLVDRAARKVLQPITVYVVPRANPDGAEHALTTHYPNRSRMVPAEIPNGVIPQDINGDGKIANMRWEDPAGAFAVDPEDDRLLVPRRPGDKGPFYCQCVEGLIHEYDGGPVVTGAKTFDYNRNFPAGWDHAVDASRYPFEQTEPKAVGAFLFDHPNIFAALDYHGGTPAILYTAGIAGKDVPQADLELMLEIGRMGRKASGLPLMNGRDYRASWRKPCIMPGSFKDFAYDSLGLSAYTVEIGWGFSSAGLGPDLTFEASDEEKERDFMRRVLAFHDRHADTDPRVPFLPWKSFDHPQLGRVQIGGITYEARAHVYPPHLRQLSAGVTAFALKHAAHHPRLVLSGVDAVAVAPGVHRVRANVANVGGFDTNVMTTGLASPVHAPVTVALDVPEGSDILSRPATYRFKSLARRGRECRPLEWFVAVPSGTELAIRAAHPRCGICRRIVDLQ